MADTAPSGRQQQVQRRTRDVRRARSAGLRSVSRITRLSVAISIALTAAFSAVTAVAFSGHTSKAAASTSGARTVAAPTSGGQLVALPPNGGGKALAAPVAPPIVAVRQPQVVSGGS